MLVVTHAFADFRRGDRIRDAQQIQKLLASTNAANVVRVLDPEIG